MGKAAKITASLSSVTVIVMAVSGIASYAFDFAWWKFLGIPILVIFVYATLISLILAFLQNVFFKPSFYKQISIVAKQFLRQSGDGVGGLSDRELAYAEELVDARTAHIKKSFIVGGIIGLVSYFLLGPNVGSPVSEIVTLLILYLSPTVIRLLTGSHLIKLRDLNPDTFDAVKAVCDGCERGVLGL